VLSPRRASGRSSWNVPQEGTWPRSRCSSDVAGHPEPILMCTLVIGSTEEETPQASAQCCCGQPQPFDPSRGVGLPESSSIEVFRKVLARAEGMGLSSVASRVLAFSSAFRGLWMGVCLVVTRRCRFVTGSRSLGACADQGLEELLLALKRDAEPPPSRLRRRKYNNVALAAGSRFKDELWRGARPRRGPGRAPRSPRRPAPKSSRWSTTPSSTRQRRRCP